MAMPQLNHNQLIAQFDYFRQQLRECFESYSDSIIDLLDALAGNSTGVNSVAELSLNPLFSRNYNSVYKAIKESFNTNIKDKEKLLLKIQKRNCSRGIGIFKENAFQQLKEFSR